MNPSTTLPIPTFVDLQGFIVDGKFSPKEAAVLKKGSILSHYFFQSPLPWQLLTVSEKSQATWLIRNHHGLCWDDGYIPYNLAIRLITKAVVKTIDEEEIEDDDQGSLTSTKVYVKGQEKRLWLMDIIPEELQRDIEIETMDTDFENITSLSSLNITNTMRCTHHTQNCALQNVFKLFNWWSDLYRDDNVKNDKK